MHADHHLGLLRLIHERKRLGSPPLPVVGPTPLQTWLDEVSELDAAFAGGYCFFDCAQLLHPSGGVQDGAMTALGALRACPAVESAQTVLVDHCHLA